MIMIDGRADLGKSSFGLDAAVNCIKELLNHPAYTVTI